MGTKREKPTKHTEEGNEVRELDADLINSLEPQVQRYVHLLMTGQYTKNKIAELLGVHPNTILKWSKRKDVQAVISDMQEANHLMVANQLKTLTVQATERLHALMNSPIDGVALQAVKDVLDRAGHKTKNEIKIDKTVTTVEEKMRKLIDDTIDDDVIEGEYEDVEE